MRNLPEDRWNPEMEPLLLVKLDQGMSKYNLKVEMKQSEQVRSCNEPFAFLSFYP